MYFSYGDSRLLSLSKKPSTNRFRVKDMQGATAGSSPVATECGSEERSDKATGPKRSGARRSLAAFRGGTVRLFGPGGAE